MIRDKVDFGRALIPVTVFGRAVALIIVAMTAGSAAVMHDAEQL